MSYSASELKSNYYENQTPIFLKNTYFVTEILIKEENYSSFHFIFVFSYIFVLLSENGAHCSYLVLFIGLILWYLIFFKHIRWPYKANHC